jgi:hypothetical protein
MSAGVGVCVALACRDAPTTPSAPRRAPPDSVVAPVIPGPEIPLAENQLAIDTLSDYPPQARILNPYTEIGFYRPGERNIAEFRSGMEYSGNRASMLLRYAVSGLASLQGEVSNETSSYFSLETWRGFHQSYPVEVPSFCGLTLNANTDHRAWWHVLIPKLPEQIFLGAAALAQTRAPAYHLEPCEGEWQPVTTSSGPSGGTNGGGYLTITTCWYWLTIVNGKVVNVEFDHCETTTIPIDENYAFNEM